VINLEALSGGASRQTWSCDVIMSDGRVVPVIVRRNPPSASGVSMAPEAQALEAAAAAGVPVPQVYVATDDPAVLGAPAMLMQRLNGETLPKRILGGDAYAAARRVMTAQCGQALAAIHGIAPDAVPSVPSSTNPLSRIEATLATTGGTYPALEASLEWLRRNEPAPTTTVPVVLHGDFRLGNLLVDERGLEGVIDWELVHLGDPCEDLAWLCTKAWRFGRPGPVGGFGDRADLLRAYENAGGPQINPQTLRWWEVLSTLKWAVMCVEQSALYLNGVEDSLELLSLGRRISESEWDLLNDLDRLDPPGARDAAPTDPDEPALLRAFSSPDVGDIVEAVRKFLGTEIVAATDGRQRYLARVAANLLAIAGRELAATTSTEPMRSPLDRLAVPSREHLRRQVEWKLRNDNPAYLDSDSAS
jgi:aminoglycoside phosphotransferase (APT) family kinase protein